MRNKKTLIGFALSVLLCSGAFSGLKSANIANAVATPICKIGSTTYTSLKSALDAANANQDHTTITMLADWDQTTVDKDEYIMFRSPITLDLGDNTLSIANRFIYIQSVVVINATNGGIVNNSTWSNLFAFDYDRDERGDIIDSSQDFSLTINGGNYCNSGMYDFDVTMNYDGGFSYISELSEIDNSNKTAVNQHLNITGGSFTVSDSAASQGLQYLCNDSVLKTEKSIPASSRKTVVFDANPYKNEQTDAGLKFRYSDHLESTCWRKVSKASEIVEGRRYCLAYVEKGEGDNPDTISVVKMENVSNAYSRSYLNVTTLKDQKNGTYKKSYYDNFYYKKAEETISETCPLQVGSTADTFTGDLNLQENCFTLVQHSVPKTYLLPSYKGLTNSEIESIEADPSSTKTNLDINWIFSSSYQEACVEKIDDTNKYWIEKVVSGIKTTLCRYSYISSMFGISSNSSGSERFIVDPSLDIAYPTSSSYASYRTLSLYYYSPEHVESDVTKIGMRFGKTIDKATYDLFDSNATRLGSELGFGIIISRKTALNGDELTIANASYNSVSSIARVSDETATTEDANGNYYHYSLLLDNFTERLCSVTYTARAYAKIGSSYYYANERSFSVKTLAQAYLDAADTSAYTEALNALRAITNL